MGKYSDTAIEAAELTDIAHLINVLTGFDQEYIAIDHVQLGDRNGELIGKLQYEKGQWTFRARRHDKPGVLGE